MPCRQILKLTDKFFCSYLARHLYHICNGVDFFFLFIEDSLNFSEGKTFQINKEKVFVFFLIGYSQSLYGEIFQVSCHAV